MIIVKMQGGLGNQMFQYAAGYNLGKILNQRVYYDIDWYSQCSNRRFELRGLPIHVLTNDLKKRYVYKFQSKICSLYEKYFVRTTLERTYRRIALLFGVYIESNKYLMESPRELLNNTNRIMLFGYFQNELFFRENYDEIKKCLRKKIIQNIEINFKLETICVHIRCGDYIGDDYYHICTKQYYNKAISKIKNMKPNAKILIFSDDINYVKNHMDIFYEYEFCEEKNTKKALGIMSSCDYFVLSNSTYSWWAQELNDGKNKIVVAPSKWYADERDKFGLYRNNWLLIDV